MKFELSNVLLIATLLFIFYNVAKAEPVTLSLTGTGTPYTLEGKASDNSHISFDVFCLDFNKQTPVNTPLQFDKISGDKSAYNGALLARAQWIAWQQDVGAIDRQKVIWSLFANIELSAAQQTLKTQSAVSAGSVSLANTTLLVPRDTTAQGYLVIAQASSAVAVTAQTPEPASLCLLGSGLALISWRRKKTII